MKNQIPITIINGYLGSGKTTLLKHILTNNQGYKIALIVNDLAELNIDSLDISKDLEIMQASDQLIELSNGCICCDLKSDLVETIESFVNKGTYDYILVESSGITEPIPVAQSILYGQTSNNKLLANLVTIDSMITVVDAYLLKTEFNLGDDLHKHNLSTSHHDHEHHDENNDLELDENYEKVDGLIIEQIEFSNIIILNKIDLVSEEELNKIKAYINLLKPNAFILESTYTNVSLESILNVKLFNPNEMINNMGWIRLLNHNVNDEHEHHHHDHNHGEHYGISSFVYRAKKPFDANRLSHFYNELPKKIIRSKGIVWLSDDNNSSYLLSQAGKSLKFDYFSNWLAASDPKIIKKTLEENQTLKSKYDPITGDRQTELVFIGISIDENEIRQILDWALVTEDEFNEKFLNK